MGGVLGKSSKPSPAKAAKDEAAKSKEIDLLNQKDQVGDAEFTKLLLLGAGESGKSTIFRQMNILYGKGLTREDRARHRESIHENCIFWMQQLVDASEKLAAEGSPTDLSDYKAQVDEIKAIPKSSALNKSLVATWKKLWATKQIQFVYANRSRFQVGDSASYFYGKLDELVAPDYLPSSDDVLRVRVKTTGIIETNFELLGNKFRVIDVGGQRSERKKWMNCFDSVTGVIFVVALSEYDQLCQEDEKTNRMDESLSLFADVCTRKELSKTALILFLNKSDLFREKIEKVPLTVYDPSYKGSGDFESTSEHITRLFLAKNPTASRQIFVHVTCATNRENINVVFHAVKEIVLKVNLMQGGLL